MLRLLIVLSLTSLTLIGIISCEERNKIREVNLENRKTLNVSGKEGSFENNNTLRIAIGSMITPGEGYAYYKQLLEYIGNKIGRDVKLIDRDTYKEVNNLLKSGNIDVAFVCGRPYVDGHDEFGLELLVAPQINGKTEYYSYIIVHIDSPVETFEELRGKTFAFTDPISNSGKLTPTYMLAKMNDTPDSFFEKYVYTYAHDKSIKAVANGIISGAAVDSLIWEYYNKKYPEITSKTKIIIKSPPYGIPPVVVSPGIDPELKNRLRKIFLDLHNDEKSKKILERMMINKFVVVEDNNYYSIREMIALLEQENRDN
jgi:phosphonate transport system substrate-binding protein